MVIPTTSMDSLKPPHRFTGDGKRIRVQINAGTMLVTGTGNRIDVDQNDGDVRIIGDGCWVRVRTGTGRIEYLGDGGVVETGLDFRNVTYKGDGGKIMAINSERNPAAARNTRICVRNKVNCHIKVPCIHININKLTSLHSKSKRS